MEFTAGFVCGVVIVLVVWLMLHRTTRHIHIHTDGKIEARIDSGPAIKPDNKRVRQCSSVEYRNERAYVESQRKRAKHEGIS